MFSEKIMFSKSMTSKNCTIYQDLRNINIFEYLYFSIFPNALRKHWNKFRICFIEKNSKDVIIYANLLLKSCPLLTY